jgi:hypothetical protein
MPNAKRTDRLELPRQLRVDSEMGRKIRMRADLNRRSIQNEILYLMDLAIKAEEGGFCQLASDGVGQQKLPLAGPVRSRQVPSRKETAA